MTDSEIELPPYLGVLVVDTERYGSNQDQGQQYLAEAVPDVLEVAFGRAGLSSVWQERQYDQNTGDGVGFGFDPRHLPAVIGRLLPRLQEVLAEKDVRMRERSRGLRLRLRAALHVGPVLMPGGGRALVTAHRLVDTPPLRDALTRSDKDRTFLAVLLSDRVYDDVVAAGYVSVSTAPVPVRAKEYEGTAHLYVPVPTGDLLGHGLATPAEEARLRATPPPAAAAVHNVMTGLNTGTAIQVGHLHGGLHNNS
ncbi:hypothetical protein [Actinokineospora sp. NBRC 105648]|uniref:hypothetical protein n=1 Tax=Actinokineospora sp. NBRC 105648 TaxID=3032206 RepID=UPI0024A589F5|nr:hypothetical protein [Actinokineospora sp. NBRC 105648]GLZ39047.1 hypothetical protein Acsp05_26710 [Actinokineospora sp. NBRC 105648]